MEEFLQTILLLVGIALYGTLMWMLVQWCIADAKLRNRSPIIVCCAVILFFPWGWIAWLVFRPDETGGSPHGLKRYR